MRRTKPIEKNRTFSGRDGYSQALRQSIAIANGIRAACRTTDSVHPDGGPSWKYASILLMLVEAKRTVGEEL